MNRYLFPLAFATFALMVGNAALATVNRFLEVDRVEICHREGGTAETCGSLPSDTPAAKIEALSR